MALPVSLLNISTILYKIDQFKGSFYKIYVVISIHVGPIPFPEQYPIQEMIMYFVKYPIIRLPLFTGANCPLVSFYDEGHFFGLDIIHFIHWHVGFTVLMLETTIAMDRWIIILFESKWKRVRGEDDSRRPGLDFLKDDGEGDGEETAQAIMRGNSIHFYSALASTTVS